MIASVFKKSKPINFVIVFALVLFMFVYANIKLSNNMFSITVLGKEIVLFCVSIFTVLLLNFIVVKNKITEPTSYHILVYGVFLALFPLTLVAAKMLLANVFVLLAFRRLISLKSKINIKQKLFDAALWIAIASLFYFWCISFFLLIYITLFLYSETRIKNWIIPFTGVLAVAILLVAYHLVVHNSLDTFIYQLPNFNFDFSTYNSPKMIIAITVLLSFGNWAIIFYIKSLKGKLKVFKPSHKIIVVFTVLTFGVALLSENKDSSEFIFMFAPLSIVISNYLDTINENWFKELFLSILVLMPFVLLVL